MRGRGGDKGRERAQRVVDEATPGVWGIGAVGVFVQLHLGGGTVAIAAGSLPLPRSLSHHALEVEDPCLLSNLVSKLVSKLGSNLVVCSALCKAELHRSRVVPHVQELPAGQEG